MEGLVEQVQSLISSEPDEICNYANVSAHLFHALNEGYGGAINWLGFYRVVQEDTLLLGPFQGKVACLRIPFGRGVCGEAAAKKSTVVVPDVSLRPGHIACDSASQSELVIPVFDHEGHLRAVLDVDSSVLHFFTGPDAELVRVLEKCAEAFKRPPPPAPAPRQIHHAPH